ncbi:MAG TPA: CheR family methyltransferase, partial [Planctomycetota bacterium]|nr:CheR family methyltransferase [Planctomycetota bacterium]
IQRRIQRRMLLLKMESPARYLQVLRENADEVQALFHELVINVTGFFRESETFDLLKKRVFPGLLRDASDPESSIRIWVPGCSTGEEPYSIAMSLLEVAKKMGREPNVQIFATDVDDVALEKARAGVYPESVQSDISPDRLRRFFTKVTGGYQVGRLLREMCVFARQNVTRDPPFSKLDIVSCRNLLIYLGSILQRQALVTFHYALKPTGILVLGRNETVGSSTELFAPMDKKQRLYTKKPGAAIAPTQGFLVHPYLPSQEPRKAAAETTATDVRRQADRLVLARYSPTGVIIDASFRVLEFRGRTGSYLEPAAGSASLNLLKMAREGLSIPLKTIVERAAKKKAAASATAHVRMKENGGFRDVLITATPLRSGGSQDAHFLVLFEEERRRGREKAAAAERPPSSRPLTKPEARDLAETREELASTKQYLQSIIEDQEASNEELRSANEEIQSSNEELQSANEELETAKEELQSTNEELTTVNDELQARNSELSTVNNDLHNLLASASIPIVMLGRDLRVRRFTPPASRVLNLIPTDVGRPLADINPNVNVPDLEDLLVGVLDHLRVLEREVQDRAGRWYGMTIRPYQTVDNKIDGVVMSFVDVDSLKRNFEDMRSARDFSEAIVETIREPLVVLDGDLRVQSANRAFYQTFQLGREEVEQRPLSTVGAGQFNVPELREALEKVLPRDLRVLDLEIEREFGALGRRTLLVNVRKLERPDGGLILLAFDDITETKRAAEVRYRRLFESSNDGLLVVNGESGQVADASPSLLEIFGLDRTELLGRRLWETDLFHDTRVGEEVFAKGRARDPIGVVPLMTREGKWLDLEIVSTSYGEAGQALLLMSFRDVTARRRAEETARVAQDELRQSQKMEAIGRLAGGIAHDFNNIATTILGFGDILVERLGGDEDMHQAAVEIKKAGERAAALTRQLLAFSRRQKLQPKVLDLNDVVKDVEPMLRRLVGERIAITTYLAPDIGSVKADVHQLEQAILNLAINARDAMPKGGRLHIQTSSARLLDEDAASLEVRPGAYSALTIGDTGVGMDVKVQAHLFEPFFTTKDKGQGTGLGLSMVYGLVRQSGGAIRVHSEVGRGTTIRIYLPRSDEEPAERPAAPHWTEAPGGDERVLLVEDEESVRSLAAQMLRKRGYQVLEAGAADEALALARRVSDPIDLLVSDVVMPGQSGPELYRMLRSARPELRVLFMSGYPGGELMEQDGELGSAPFLQKPFTTFDLCTSVRGALDGDHPAG